MFFSDIDLLDHSNDRIQQSDLGGKSKRTLDINKKCLNFPRSISIDFEGEKLVGLIIVIYWLRYNEFTTS